MDRAALDDRVRVLSKRAEANGLGALSQAERAIVVTWWATGIIGNGGFEYFYEGFHRHQDRDQALELERGLRFLGFPAAAEACRRSREFFPPEILTGGDDGAAADYLHSRTEEEVRAHFEPLNRTIWALDDEDRYETAVARALEPNL